MRCLYGCMSGGATLDVAYESGCPSGGANLLGDPSKDVGGLGYRDNGGEEGKEGRAVCDISLGHNPPCCLEEVD